MSTERKCLSPAKLNLSEQIYRRIANISDIAISRAKRRREPRWECRFSLFIFAPKLDFQSLHRGAQVRQYWTWLKRLSVGRNAWTYNRD